MNTTTDTMADLARRAVACPGWRWMPGMWVLVMDTVIEDDPYFDLDGAFRAGRCGDDAGPFIRNPAGDEDTWRTRGDGRWDLCCYIRGDLDQWGVAGNAELVPDLTDPATIGCLLALVREAWGDDAMTTQHHPQDGSSRPWRVWLPGVPVAYGPTEAAALVAALEVAP